MIDNKSLLCAGLPSKPDNKIGDVLVTGASGYIGGRLIPELLERGYRVRAMVRGLAPVYKAQWPNLDVVEADAMNLQSLKMALSGVDTAFYLLHSLLLGPERFEAADISAAINFREAAAERGVKRIIYLGGLGDTRVPLSSHLRNRIEVARELKKGKVPVTILRAGIIIGSGSASYEIIKHLVLRLPVIFIPRWAKNKCQPIAVRDVVKYLVGCMETPATKGGEFDIGGRSVITYERMMKLLAVIRGKKRFFVPVFFSNIRFYAYFASLLTPVPDPLTECLMEGLVNKVVCQDSRIRKIIPFEPISYKESLLRAMAKEEDDKVSTRWSDAYPRSHETAVKLHELKKRPEYNAYFDLLSGKAPADLFKTICKVGGDEGWFNNNWMWRMRGMLDRILLGVGSSRGRKSHSTLRINDVIDFWRIEDLKKNTRLLLRAEMKIPGMAWLEFNIKDEGNKRRLAVIAYYETRTFLGRLYWYVFMPFHKIIFDRLIKDIENRS